MPEAVAKYTQKNDFEEVRQIHKDILRTYELDFAKHATPADAAKISLNLGYNPQPTFKRKQEIYLFRHKRKR